MLVKFPDPSFPTTASARIPPGSCEMSFMSVKTGIHGGKWDFDFVGIGFNLSTVSCCVTYVEIWFSCPPIRSFTIELVSSNPSLHVSWLASVALIHVFMSNATFPVALSFFST